MQIHVLASGSSGNAVYLQDNNLRILIDAGISARRIEHGLGQLNTKPSELDAIFITHEHIDHIKGLEVLAKKFKLPVYTRESTWNTLLGSGKMKLARENIRIIKTGIEIKDMVIEAFSIPHDAVDPVGFAITSASGKAVLATDLGIITPEVEKHLSCCDFLVLETNHDPEMLAHGPYPAFLKQRIKSNNGHLSNEAAAQTLCRTTCKMGVQVFLAHISQHNNHPQLAQQTVTRWLQIHGCQVGQDVVLIPTFPDHMVSSKIKT